MSRLEILQKSLEKKKMILDKKFNDHFDTVKQANGQPLNDKRNGASTFRKWGRQNDSIRKQLEEIEKTERAIERENFKQERVKAAGVPDILKSFLEAGRITQWRKHPRFFFVVGVEKARIFVEDGKVMNRYYLDIPTQEQKDIFKDIYTEIKNAERARNEKNEH